MYRKIFEYLKEWKDSPYRKPLLIQGARQVGKTYSILNFGKSEYENIAYFNFETNPKLKETFEENIEPIYLIPILSRLVEQTIVKEKTLIFFDEIQLCERALTSLKYFQEQAPEYHIIVAGSLLGVAINRENFSFPVGKVDIKTLYPMDIEEFLLAMGEDKLIEQIKISFNKNSPLPTILHDLAMEYYRKYLLIGGMPECVAKFKETENYTLIRHTQEMILLSYLNDMSKYNTNNEIKKTRLVYDNITVQLSRENTRFQYKLVKTGGRASEFENAIEWLNLSGIISKIYCVQDIKKPLENYRNIDAFKIYISDVGLLCAKKQIVPEDILYLSDELNDFKGGMTENYVNIHLNINSYTPYFWKNEKGTSEIDFVIARDGKIIPIEVKSSNNTRSKSLDYYIKTYKPEYSIRISSKNFGLENNIKSIPLYAVFCL